MLTTAYSKRMATLTARCALAGITLHRLADDRGRDVFIVSRWALTRELADLDEVEQWLDRVARPQGDSLAHTTQQGTASAMRI